MIGLHVGLLISVFEKNKLGDLTPLHHPFTAPNCSIDELLASPLDVLTDAYDLVLNGTELGGGSVRIHNQDMQRTVLNLLKIDDDEAEEKFGFIINSAAWLPTACWASNRI